MDELTFSKPVVCTLTPAAQRAETKRFKADLAPHVLKRERLSNGTRLTFAAVSGLREKIEMLVELDKGCCAYLDHQIESDARTITLSVRSEGQGIALAQEFLTDLPPTKDAKVRGDIFKMLALVGACGVACSAPLILGAVGLGVASIGLGTTELEIGILGLVAAGVAAYVYYRKRAIAVAKGGKNANRCGC